jgi:hypothetical protein
MLPSKIRAVQTSSNAFLDNFRVVGYTEVVQKRASRRSIIITRESAIAPEADFWIPHCGLDGLVPMQSAPNQHGVTT